MKRFTIVMACMMLSSVVIAQHFDPNSYWGQQQIEIGNTIQSEVEAQVRQQQSKAKQSQTQTQTQTTNQQALENFNNWISAEGQRRMEYYNNPDIYIDRSITNRKPSINSSNQNSISSGHNPQSQRRDLRTEPVHSENLNSKSLQMLREANREYFSNEHREETINPNAQVPLFDAPSLGVPLWQELEEEMDMEAVYSELSPEQKATYDKKKKEIMEHIENLEFEAKIARFDAGIDRAVEENGGATLYDNLRWYKCKEKIAQEEEKLRQLDDSARRIVQKKLKKKL